MTTLASPPDARVREMSARLHRERAVLRITCGWGGGGWSIVPAPVRPHEELGYLVRRTNGVATGGYDFPPNWRCRWALMPWMLGCVIREPYRLLLIQEKSAVHTSEEELLHTIVHELSHLHTPADHEHGPEFARTLKEFELNVFGRLDASHSTWARYLPPRRSSVLSHLSQTTSGGWIGFCEACHRWRPVPAETVSPQACPMCSQSPA
jgi:hypothetical protein